MTKKEMVRNVQKLVIEERAIPAIKLEYNITVDSLNERLRNAMFERFVSEVTKDSELCGVSPMESRKFAVNFIKNNEYVKNCLTATINLVLNGAFSKRWELDSFIDKLLWSHVVKACHK